MPAPIQTRANQHPVRNYAIFLVLLHTGLRISELHELTLKQYDGKHFKSVMRKGKAITRNVFLSKDAREALDRYIEEDRGKKPGVRLGVLAVTSEEGPLMVHPACSIAKVARIALPRRCLETSAS